jgi:cell division protein FtsW
MVTALKRYFKGDGVIWAVVIGLLLYSMLAVYSSTGTLAYKYQGGNTSYYLIKHLIFLIFSVLVVFVVHHINYRYFSKVALLLLYLSIPLLALTLFSGTSLNEAKRWLTLPIVGFTIQTSDIAKLAIIMYVARMLSMKQNNIKDLREGFLPIIVPVLMVVVLILPANFSTSSLILLVAIVLMFIGRINFKHILAMIGLGVAFIGLIFLFYKAIPDTTSKVLPRVDTWFKRVEVYRTGESEANYQAEQAKIAISTGGLIGKGPGKSTQRNFLPEPYSDFIYAIIIEEYGLLFGGIPILLLYLYLFYRTGVIVKKSRRTFPAFLAIGLSLTIVIQAMVNIAVNTNILPVTGQTLPLVSMGGTSMLFTSIAFGMILSVSRSMKEGDFNENTEQNQETEQAEDEENENYS